MRKTPQLESLLSALRGRLGRQVWLHGLGTLLAILTAWLVFAFFADRILHVPLPVRVGHGLVLLGLALLFGWKKLVKPLLSLPSRSGLAILFEREHPEVQERFVSAVQFQGSEHENGSPALVDRVLEEADALASKLGSDSSRDVIDSSKPRSRFFLGSAAVFSLVFAAVLNPVEARIFFARVLGSSTPWPQSTILSVEIPLEGPGVRITRTEDQIHVRVARGTDVPILVRAAGEIPDEVRLSFDIGRDMVLSPSGGGAFRTLLRSCQENLAFFATGGDDLDGKPSVAIEVLRPPDVEGIAFEVRPPEYSGLEPSVLFQREIDVLAGSEVRVHILPEPRTAEGTVRILPDDRTVALKPAPFPLPAGVSAEDATEPGPIAGLAFDWIANQSIGLRIDLVDKTHLTNPDPGLFRIRVIEDRAPEVQVLQPTRSEFEIVKGGAFALRVRGEDDFGLESMQWRISRASDEGTAKEGSFDLIAVADEGALLLEAPSGTAPIKTATAHLRLDVMELGTEAEPVSVDQRFEIEISAMDNRRPEAGIGRSTRFRARVVTPEELLRRMQDRLSQARLATVRLYDLQREKQQRVRELLESSNDDSSGLRAESLALSSALAGQRRVAVDARALARELAIITEDILYARADEKAGPLLDHLDAEMAKIQDALFDPSPWLSLAKARKEGLVPSGGFAGNLVSLVDLSLEISEIHAPDAALAMVGAEKASNAAEVRGALVDAEALQTRSLKRIDDLLVRLAEWDNFQNILSLTRDILNRQKALQERTQQFASKK